MCADYLSAFVGSVTIIDIYGFVIPLLVYAALIAIYGIFVWAYYKSLSKRDLFRLNINEKMHFLRVKIFYFLKYIIVFPVLTFLWFGGMAMILFFLSKSQTTQNILLISMGLVAATRVTAYVREELSADIAKIMPLAVIGIFVVDPSFFSLTASIARFSEAANLAPLLVKYLVFVMLMEFVLRVALAIKRNFWPNAHVKMQKEAAINGDKPEFVPAKKTLQQKKTPRQKKEKKKSP
jgi:hypothetical protein